MRPGQELKYATCYMEDFSSRCILALHRWFSPRTARAKTLGVLVEGISLS